ncbi:hypothetical protein H257_06922 [Aphanomyces astaci]|uniref:Thioredoxin n=1 Tax=Aphanomyces astaci TaxID=112090 RepID=W4GJ00_APHAT|nr:hypothetical protein H257_06922 [Aphanomyces astaci]ETV79670.1 hypothetical protein H257_06922 [Aphanomyces astaci]KAF0747704.1 hypothetical protein AaE_007623 [Aphanomyces astaci]RHY15591.1 hypothetical protein DYB36_006211 [Aphanomyces astaci]RHY21571.1 hypothetical protein DYB25_006336 [Aphanomyces astaci]RHY36911.1 hypothetical protein DYB34_000937 [Aphanomyces astaci]|eukprot:XP_009830606.1 hypothetical protein H257_06922 [Aphanomyces astaci]
MTGVHVLSFASASAFKSEIAKPEYQGKLIVVDFTATWCGPCQGIKPRVHDLAREEPSVVFFEIDVDESDSCSGELGISAMPTFHLYKDSAKVGELVGANFAALKALIDQNK